MVKAPILTAVVQSRCVVEVRGSNPGTHSSTQASILSRSV